MLNFIVKKVKDYLAFQDALATLTQADDRMLADIGLSRGEIRDALRTGRR